MFFPETPLFFSWISRRKQLERLVDLGRFLLISDKNFLKDNKHLSQSPMGNVYIPHTMYFRRKSLVLAIPVFSREQDCFLFLCTYQYKYILSSAYVVIDFDVWQADLLNSLKIKICFNYFVLQRTEIAYQIFVNVYILILS